jgi:hypothetical protein
MRKMDILKCLEIISVRTAKQQDFDVALKICSEASLSTESGNFTGMSVYRNDGYGSDLIVHIHWSFDSSEPKKSLLGRQLALALNYYGIVSHTLLIDQQVQIPGITDPTSRRSS